MERIKQNKIDLPSCLPGSSFFFFYFSEKKTIVFLGNVLDSYTVIFFNAL